MILTFLYQNVSKHLHAHYTEAIETLTDWLKIVVFASSVLVNDMRTKQHAPLALFGVDIYKNETNTWLSESY